MDNHRLLSDDEFEIKFFYRDIKDEDFTHEAHIRLAWIHISKYGLKQAVKNIQLQISAFAKAQNSNIYNDTVTVAAVKIVNHYMLLSTTKNFTDFIKEYPELNTGFKEILATYYSYNVFKSIKAKNHYIAPDLKHFEQ